MEEKSKTIERKPMAGDMTQGKILKPLLFFALPMLFGNVFQQLYNTVDSIVVGQYVGGEALAAVGTSFPVLHMLVALFMGIAMGSGVMVSQYFGAKDFVQLKKAVRTSITLTLIVGFGSSVLGLFLAKPMLHLLNTPANVFDMAYEYVMIIFLATPASLLYNIISGILRGLGDSKWPLFFLIVASVINIVLDLLFVAVFRWGIAGAAWATLIAQFCAAVFSFIKLQHREEYVRLKRGDLRIDRDIVKHLIRLGLPSGLQDTAFSVGMIVIQSFTNTFGYAVMAAGNAVMRVDGFAVMPMGSISMATTTFIGQNVGAGKLDRVKKGARTAMLLIIGIGGTLSALVVIFGPALMRLFTSDPRVLEVGGVALRILGPFYWLLGLSFLLGGILRGAGDALFPAIISLTTMILVRIPLAYFLAVKTGDYRGLYFSMISGFTIGAVANFLRFISGKWRGKAVTRGPIATEEAAASES